MRLSFVAHGSQAIGCQCGGGQPLGEQIRQVLGGMTLAYGAQIQSEFIDLDDPSQSQHPLALRCHKDALTLPALFIEHEPRFTGVIPLTALKSLLDEMGLVPTEYLGVEE